MNSTGSGPEKVRRLGIMTAMDEEFSLIAQRFSGAHSELVGPRKFLRVVRGDHELILVSSRIGKVAAGVTSTLLIDRFNVDSILFTGVAGAATAEVRVGDIVVADALVQHDFDLKGVMGFERFDIPLLGARELACSRELALLAQQAAHSLISNADYRRGVAGFTSHAPHVHRGIIASGDTFICDDDERDELARSITNLKCVEMEGAAVAQVCIEHNVPFAVARIISDEASHQASIDFGAFVQSAAAVGSDLFVESFVGQLFASE